jgi:hypothetical protein
MPVKMKPTSTIKARLGLSPNGKVQRFLTNTCYKHMDRYVPYKEGDLRSTVDIKADSITYEMPYAHYQYEGILYVDPDTGSSWARKDVTKVSTDKSLQYHTPGTGHHWDKRMWSAEKEKVISEVQSYINRGGK